MNTTKPEPTTEELERAYDELLSTYGDTTVTINEASRRLHVPPYSVSRWLRQGNVHSPVPVASRQRRFPVPVWLSDVALAVYAARGKGTHAVRLIAPLTRRQFERRARHAA